MLPRVLKNFADASPLRGFTPGRLGLLLGAFVCVAFPGVLLNTSSFFYRDFGLFGLPLATYHKQAILNGEIPLWNPLNNCGIPFLAQWNTMTLYPLSLIYILFPLPWSLNVFCLLHLVFAGISMFLLARRWICNPLAASVAGIGFAWNGLALHSLMWPNNIAALAWMPLVILTVERAWTQGGRSCFSAALVAALQMLTGAPEIILFTWGILLFLICTAVLRHKESRRAMLFRFAGVGMLVSGLAAAQLLPFLDLLRHAHRTNSFAGDAWALPPWGLANLLVPLFRSTPSLLNVYSQDEQQWTSSYYPGIGIVALSLIACCKHRESRVRLLSLVTLLGFWMAFGKPGYLYDSVLKLFPPLGFVRFPIKFIIPAMFSLPLLAAAGFNCLQNVDSTRLRQITGRTAVFHFLVIATILGVAFWFPFSGDRLVSTSVNAGVRIAWLLLILSLIWWYYSTPRNEFKNKIGLAMLLVLGADVLTHAPAQNPVAGIKAFARTPNGEPSLPISRAMVSPQANKILDHASTPDADAAWLGFQQARYCNANLLDGTAKVDGFYSLYLAEESAIRQALYSSSSKLPLVEFLGVSQITQPNQLFTWTNSPGAMPLIATGGQKPVFASQEKALAAVTSTSFNPAREVYLPEQLANISQETNASSNIHILDLILRSQAVQFKVNADGPGWVVIAQNYFHPWKARVDGKPRQLVQANYAYQALEVSAGTHNVEIKYVDWSFRLGLCVSGLTLIGCLSGWFLMRLKSPTGASIPSVEAA